MYKRVLLKLSGEAISAPDFPFDGDIITDVADQIKEISQLGVRTGVVIGGGNIARGRLFEEMGFDRVQSDYAGMLGTVINALILSAKLNQMGVKAKAMSAIKAESVDLFDADEANRLLDEGYVLIFGGGVGKPYHSTDTGSAQRAKDIHADVILMAKSGVDGVYDSDPDTNPDAKRFDELSFSDILDLGLKVIDLQAAELCKEAKIEAFVFSMAGERNIVKAVKNETVGTHITF
jgi:uridylate kinase